MARRRSHHGLTTKTIGDAKKNYISAINTAKEYKYYVKSMATFFGVSEDAIERSKPYEHWKKFAENVTKYADVWEQRLKSAFGLTSSS